MTTPIGKNYSSDSNPEIPEAMEDFAYEESMDYGSESEEFGITEGDNFGAVLSADDLRNRIQMLRKSLQESSSLSGTQKQEVLDRLDALQGKVNYSQCLSPSNMALELGAINQDLSALEVPSFGLEDSDIQEMAEDSESEEAEFDPEKLKEQAKEVEKRIEELLSEGMITQDAYDKLIERFNRLDTELSKKDGDLEVVASQLSDMEETVKHMKQQYIINGEVIEDVPSAEGDESTEEDGEVPAVFSNLIGLVGGSSKQEEVLKVIKEHYPSLDKDGDGELKMKELKEAVDAKDWPPIGGPDQTMLEFLFDVDKEFKTHFEAAPNDGWQSWKQTSNRLVSLLQALYPDKKNNIKVADWNADARTWCNIWFDGQLFSFANKDNGPGHGLCDPNKEANALHFAKWSDSGGAWHIVSQ